MKPETFAPLGPPPASFDAAEAAIWRRIARHGPCTFDRDERRLVVQIVKALRLGKISKARRLLAELSVPPGARALVIYGTSAEVQQAVALAVHARYFADAAERRQIERILADAGFQIDESHDLVPVTETRSRATARTLKEPDQ